jgi:GT2 family glycosyltransferase
MGIPTRPATEIESLKRRLMRTTANLWLERRGPSAAAAIQHTLGVAPYGGLVTVVVPVLNQPELTRRFLESLYENTGLPFELVLVDNGSGPAVAALAREYAAQHANLVFIRNETNEGFGYACNQGIALARGDVVVIVNNDVMVPQGWLSRLLAVVQEDPHIGMVGPVTNRCVGPQQLFPAPYSDVEEFPRAAAARATTHAANVTTVGRLVGLCLLVPMSVIGKVGGFDPAFGFGNLEDDDLGLRVKRAGWQLAVAEDVLIHHEGSATFVGERLDAQALTQQNWEIFCLKWRHNPANTSFASIAALAGAAAFEASHDYIPPAFSQHFAAAGPKLGLGTDKPVKLLFTPDVLTPGWWAPLRTFLGAFGPDDPVALVLRPEPATNERAQQALQEASALVDQMATAKSLPVVLLEATNLPPMLRPTLYRAMTGWLDTPGPLAPFVAREAAAVGLPRVLASADAMRAFVAQHRQELT